MMVSCNSVSVSVCAPSLSIRSSKHYNTVLCKL